MQTKTEIIAEKLQAEIARGRFEGKLPSELEIAKTYLTSPVTAGKALNLLRERNIIKRIPRLGSFVNRGQNKPMRLHLGTSIFGSSMIAEISAVLKKKFPQRMIEVDAGHVSDGHNLVEDGYDVVRTVATYKFPYSKYVEPLPTTLRDRFLNNESYLASAFSIHRDNSLLYGVPILISPLVLLCNTELLWQYRRFNSPYDFTLDDLIELRKCLKDKPAIHLFDRHYADSRLRYFIFSGVDAEGAVDSLDIPVLEERLKLYWSLFGDVLRGEDNPEFLNGNVMFTCACRQGLGRYKDASFKWDIMPFPQTPGKAVPVTGEFLVVSNRTTDKGAAFEVAEAFLSPDIQKLIAKSKCGLPVLKSLMPDTLDTHCYRDDIFVSELPSMLLNNGSEQEVNLLLTSLLYGLMEGKYDFDSFLEQVVNFVQLRLRMRDAREAVCHEILEE